MLYSIILQTFGYFWTNLGEARSRLYRSRDLQDLHAFDSFGSKLKTAPNSKFQLNFVKHVHIVAGEKKGLLQFYSQNVSMFSKCCPNFTNY